MKDNQVPASSSPVVLPPVGRRGPELSEGDRSTARPDPEVVAQAKRRRFTAEYKQQILATADQAKGTGGIGALLRREGLYSSLLATWRRERDSSPSMPTAARPCGPNVALLLADLSVTKTHSRPYRSNDNPYSESQFRTMKYRPEFPDRFGCIQDSRAFCQTFFPWYNDEHRHSGIGMMSPSMVLHGAAVSIRENRELILDAAYRDHPDRFVRRPPSSPQLPKEVWINKPLNSEEETH